jgi:hypothetical protein
MLTHAQSHVLLWRDRYKQQSDSAASGWNHGHLRESILACSQVFSAPQAAFLFYNSETRRLALKSGLEEGKAIASLLMLCGSLVTNALLT